MDKNKLISFDQLPEVAQQTNEATQETIVRLQRIEKLLQDHMFLNGHKLDKPYTLSEAAEYCRMPVPTFRKHLSKRNVSGSKLGKRWLFTKEDLDKYLQSFHYETKDEIKEGVEKALRTQRRGKAKELAVKHLN